MNTTRTASRYILRTRYAGEMAQVLDTADPRWGVRHHNPTVTRLLPYAEAEAIRDRLNAAHTSAVTA